MEKRDVGARLLVGIACLAALGFTTGCGNPATDGSEAIASTEAAMTVSSCAAATADQNFTGGIDPAIVSPRTYNTCTKAYVVDIENLSSVYTGDGNALDGRIEVVYADTTITTKATCESTKLRAIVYQCFEGPGSTSTTVAVPPEGCYVLDDKSSFGSWIPILGSGTCALGYSYTQLYPGGSYRVAATARNPSNATRKVRIGTYRPQDIK